MKKSVLVLAVSVFFVCMLAAAMVHAAGPAPDACTLLTKSDAEALFNDKISSQKAGKVSAPAGNQCTYSFKGKGGSSSVKIKISSSDEIKAEGIFKSARDVFDRQKKARQANADTAKKMKSMGGIGDEAFWNGYDLWIVRGDYVLVILAHPNLPGQFKNREAMDKAREDLDLNYSQKAATMVLSKIK
ncbi:MAG: hypothetical protein ACYDHW_15525 [Syntrophorhabdaceae bacterium]